MPRLPIELGCFTAIDLYPSAPFHFDGTFHKPSFFPSGEDSRSTLWQPGRFWQTLRLDGEPFGIRLEDCGAHQQPRLRLALYSRVPAGETVVARIAAEVQFRFGLQRDLSGFLAMARGDDLLRPVVARWPGMRPFGGGLYENLMIYIVLQNATVRRSVQMLDNLMGAYGTPVVFDGQKLHAFWLARDMANEPEAALRALKLGYRDRMIVRISAQVAGGAVDEQALRALPTPELKQALLKLYGIGPASVWYVLFADFHRYEALDHISPWEQKIYSRLWFGRDLVPVAVILAEAERRWGEWKMLAAHYLFEDLFWRHANQPLPWLDELIRL